MTYLGKSCTKNYEPNASQCGHISIEVKVNICIIKMRVWV